MLLERACKAAAERADNDFRQLLLAQQEEGAITHKSSWSAVKAQVGGYSTHVSLLVLLVLLV